MNHAVALAPPPATGFYGGKDFERFLEGHASRLAFNTERGLPTATKTLDLINMYKHWVYICINKNAQTSAKVPLRLYATRSVGEARSRRKHNRLLSRSEKIAIKGMEQFATKAHIQLAEDIEEIFDHPFLDLMREVNEWENGYELRELTFAVLDLTGKAFWLIVRDGLGIPMQMHLLRPQWVKIIPDKKNFVKGFLYGRTQRDQIALGPDEVIWFKYPNPKDPWDGLSPLVAGAEAATRYTKMDIHERKLLDNGARPDFIVNYTEGELDEQTRKDLEVQWNNKYMGVNNAGKVRVTDSRFELKQLGFSPKEMAFLQGRPWTKMEICNIFSVPLALTETKDVNRANLDASKALHADQAIQPRLIRVEQKQNEKLIPMYDEPRLFVAFDNPVKEDQEFQLKVDESDLKNFVRSVNEVRMSRGLEPVVWGETPLVSGGLGPLFIGGDAQEGQARSDLLDTVGGMTGSVQILNALGLGLLGPAEASALLQLFLQITPEQATAVIPSGRSVQLQENMGKVIDVKQEPPEDATEEFPGGISGGPNPRLSKTEQQIALGVSQTLRDHEKFVLRGRSVPELRRRADQTAAVAESKKLAEKLADPNRSNFVRGGNDGIRRIEDAIVEVDGDDAPGVLLDAWVRDPNVDKLLDERDLMASKNILESNRDDVKAAISNGVAAGETIPQISARVELVYGGKLQKFALERIARTETHRAQHEGMLESWRQSEVVRGTRWDAVGDACPFCLDMQARSRKRVQALGRAYFEEGQEHVVEFGDRKLRQQHRFGDVNGPPLHPQCRCSLVPVFIPAVGEQIERPTEEL